MNNIEFGKRYSELAKEYHSITGKYYDYGYTHFETDTRTNEDRLFALENSVNNAKIAVNVVEKINQLPIGAEFTIGELAKGNNLEKKDLLEVWHLVRDAMADKIETAERFKNQIVGVPYVIPIVKIK